MTPQPDAPSEHEPLQGPRWCGTPVDHANQQFVQTDIHLLNIGRAILTERRRQRELQEARHVN